MALVVTALCRTAGADQYVLAELGTLGGNSAIAYDINNFGQVVGTSTTSSGASHAFQWVNGVMTDLGTLGGTNSVAYAINDAGTAAGAADDANAQSHPVRWTPGGPIHDLGFLPGGTMGEARDIDNNGRIVGWSEQNVTPGGLLGRAFSWVFPSMTELGTLGGFLSTSHAYGISEGGVAVGSASSGTSAERASAFVMGNVSQLQTGNTALSAGYKITNDGIAVGVRFNGFWDRPAKWPSR